MREMFADGEMAVVMVVVPSYILSPPQLPSNLSCYSEHFYYIDSYALIFFLQLDFEKAQVKKLEKELKRASSSSSSTASSPKGDEASGGSGGATGDDISPNKHKQMAILLIKERNKLIDKMLQLQQRNVQIEQTLKSVSSLS